MPRWAPCYSGQSRAQIDAPKSEARPLERSASQLATPCIDLRERRQLSGGLSVTRRYCPISVVAAVAASGPSWIVSELPVRGLRSKEASRYGRGDVLGQCPSCGQRLQSEESLSAVSPSARAVRL